ncbi:MAG: hypothetical protein HQK53_03110 [Oligoflexia bacterium]|nr:hypothetical protein [Oligoflexia bacterium]
MKIYSLLILFAMAAFTAQSNAVVVVNRYLEKAEVNKSVLCFLVAHEKNTSPEKRGSPTDTTKSLACKLAVIPVLAPERKNISDYPVKKIDVELGYEMITRVCVDFTLLLKKSEKILGVGNINTACLAKSHAKTGFKNWKAEFRPSLNLIAKKSSIKNN